MAKVDAAVAMTRLVSARNLASNGTSLAPVKAEDRTYHDPIVIAYQQAQLSFTR
jgi:hypothetical protein